MAIDHRCTVSDLAPLLVELAADPQRDTPETATRLSDIEANIASGLFTVEDWWQLERLASPSGLNCAECMAPVSTSPPMAG